MYPTTHAVPLCCGVWCIGGVCLLIMYVCFCIVVVVVAVIVVVVVGSRQVKTWYFTVGSLVIISPLTWLRSFKILAIFSVVGNVCLIAGTATSTLFGTFFTCFSAICHPRTRRGLCSTSCPYLLDADWCLRSDVTTNLRLQASSAPLGSDSTSAKRCPASPCSTSSGSPIRWARRPSSSASTSCYFRSNVRWPPIPSSCRSCGAPLAG